MYIPTKLHKINDDLKNNSLTINTNLVHSNQCVQYERFSNPIHCYVTKIALTIILLQVIHFMFTLLTCK